LGRAYRRLQHFEEAIRCLERSIELSPTKDAYVALADTHRAAGQEDLWQPTLERFFEVESMGLEHAQVHSMIARDLMAKDKLAEAEPHAAEAAQTWAAWGLSLASEVYEGLGRWEESEQWMRENSTSYPTSSGDEWYFWCRRTGRGDADEARKLTETFYTADWIKSSLDGRARHLVFRLLEDDLPAALEEAQAAVDLAGSQKVEPAAMVYYHAHLALVAHELEKAEVEQKSIAEIKSLIDEHIRKDYVDFSVVMDGFCQLLAGEMLDKEALAQLDEHLGKLKDSRCNCEYFVGRAFDLHGQVELADKYWKRAVERGPYTRYNATLAGKYLCARYGTSRP
jgi:tetratricopeptide (TPR) repeat protein